MATTSDKLENCEVCGKVGAKYTCPKCEVRTCGLSCVNIHKKELNCDGIRDKTKFVPLKQFTDLDLLSDYRLLEEVGRSVDQLQRDQVQKYGRFQNLPTHLHRLRQAATRSNVQLEFMPQNFSRHKQNTTFFNWKTNELFWRIEWIFPQAENMKWVTSRALETCRLSELLENVMDPLESREKSEVERKILSEKLQFYRSAGTGGVKVFLKAEKVRRSGHRFHELDVTESLRENLRNKSVIEFPMIYVAIKDCADMFETVDSDEEKCPKMEQNPEEPHSNWKSRRRSKPVPPFSKNPVKVEPPKAPVNFFFNNSSDSDTESMDQT